jgi:hypothetical protein
VLVIRNVVVGRLRSAGDPAQQAADAMLLHPGLAEQPAHLIHVRLQPGTSHHDQDIWTVIKPTR